MKALIIGASGATGKDLVNILLQDTGYSEVVLFVRGRLEISHPKLREIITDFEKLNEVVDQIRGDVFFSCLGTTLKAAGSKDNQRHIDYEIPLTFSKMAKANGVASLVLLSAYGASAKSKVFYSRLKGELEEGITILAFDQYIIFRPGMLLRQHTDRAGERIMTGVLKMLNTVGLIKKFRPLPTWVLAGKLARAPRVLTNGKYIIELEKIFSF